MADGDGDKTYLAQEYLLLHKAVEDFDGRALTIKAWSVTFSAAALGLAYVNRQDIILLLASLGSLIFWILETVWKTHQLAYYGRIQRIEAHFAEGAATPMAPFQSFREWDEAYWGKGMVKRWFNRMFLLNAVLPHIIVLVAGILLFVFLKPSQQPGAAATPPPFGARR